MACEVNNKEINSQCAELLVRPTYNYIYNYRTNSTMLYSYFYVTTKVGVSYSYNYKYDNKEFLRESYKKCVVKSPWTYNRSSVGYPLYNPPTCSPGFIPIKDSCNSTLMR